MRKIFSFLVATGREIQHYFVISEHLSIIITLNNHTIKREADSSLTNTKIGRKLSNATRRNISIKCLIDDHATNYDETESFVEVILEVARTNTQQISRKVS